MNQHFATSWLKSLSAKLEALEAWDYQSGGGPKESVTTHRNLFREFFSPTFQKTLACADEAKRIEFLHTIERNLYKFESEIQQFPLSCLCALLEHGKDSQAFQGKVGAWLQHLLQRLKGCAQNKSASDEYPADKVVAIMLADHFQKFLELMEESLKEKLATGLGECLEFLSEEKQNQIMDAVPALTLQIQELVTNSTLEVNQWLENAPKYPATPAALVEIFAKMEHPLVKFYKNVRDPTKKEAFLVAVALCLSSLKHRFRWICHVEPELEVVGRELQHRLFAVNNGDPHNPQVMELWLKHRTQSYNEQALSRASSLLANDSARREQLRARLQPLFAERNSESQFPAEDGWVELGGPSPVTAVLIQWLTECYPAGGYFCPPHALAPHACATILQRLHMFEIEANYRRARLMLSSVQVVAPPGGAPATAASFQVLAVAPLGQPPLAGQLPVVIAPPPSAASAGAPAMLPPLDPAEGADGPEVETLTDLLLVEAMTECTDPELKVKVRKTSDGVYQVGDLHDVTFRTISGCLFVYRIGNDVKHMPVRHLLEEQGIVPEKAHPPTTLLGMQLPGSSASSAADPGGAVAGVGSSADASSVLRIAQQAAAIQAGVTNRTVSEASVPSFISRPNEATLAQQTDEKTLGAKRVAAATAAMEVAKASVRRQMDFEDLPKLKKIILIGLKRDAKWRVAYQEHCAKKGISIQTDPTTMAPDLLKDFILTNMANSTQESWAKKVLGGDLEDGEQKEKEKKEKKDKKDKKEKKEKKAEAASVALVAVAQPPVELEPVESAAAAASSAAPALGMLPGMMGGMSMGMLPPGMAGALGLAATMPGFPGMGIPGMHGMMPGMMPGMPWGMPNLAACFPPEDARGEPKAKKAKVDKKEKKEKTEKASKTKK